MRLKYGGETLTQPVQVVRHPEIAATAADLLSQFRLLSDVRDRIEETHDAVARNRDVRSQIQATGERAEKLGKGTSFSQPGPEIEPGRPELPAGSRPPVRRALASVASSADARPTDSSWTYYKEIFGKLAAILAELEGLLGKDLPEFNAMVAKAEIPPVVVVPKKTAGSGR